MISTANKPPGARLSVILSGTTTNSVALPVKRQRMHLRDRDVRAPLDLFHRTYHSLLRSTGEIQIQALAEQYATFEPSLHHAVRPPPPAPAALTYTSLRLPACIDAVRLVLLGQSHEVFARHGYGDVL